MDQQPKGPTPEMEKAFEERMKRLAERPTEPPRPLPILRSQWKIGFQP